MIDLHVTYKTNEKNITIYNEWDVDEKDVVDEAFLASKNDIGKYFKFNDGSGWYSKILGVNSLAIRTELCTVRKEDYMHCARVQYPGTNYSGAFRSEEHELVRPFNFIERRCVDRLKTGKKIKYLTKRLRVLTARKLVNEMKGMGIDERKILNLLLNAAQKGNQKVQAIDRLAYLGGIQLEPKKEAGKSKPLFQQINNNLTIQGQRRAQAQLEEVPTGTELKKLVRDVKEKEGVDVGNLQFGFEQ